MQITIDLPNDLVQRPDPVRDTLEAVAIEGYRTEAMSHYEASQLLGLSQIQFDGFLKEHKIYDHAYDVSDLARDRETFLALKAKGMFDR